MPVDEEFIWVCSPKTVHQVPMVIDDPFRRTRGPRSVDQERHVIGLRAHLGGRRAAA
eukprot:CAMPEP_0170312728 /NCGR_PEP_ID=MMETSP0116_2-20130129/56905_1 /TAXON_ID=400756 /ORGANISM="Durinskia baltica, Strain CSIRO CS-38" /LENGTH=56 /DNA_ID=CAMNT_0010565113 /DNA_START=520 /DNA_END=686 /DNA_ORIENTATION=-